MRSIACEAKPVARSADWGTKVSVFWADRNFSLGRFPPLDRIDYLDHAIALIERERLRPPRPTLDEIRRYLRVAHHLRPGQTGRGPSRQLKYSSRRITRRICGLCCTPPGFATAGSPALWAQTTTPWRFLRKTPCRTRRQLDRARAAMSTGRRRSRFPISCANGTTGTDRRVRRAGGRRRLSPSLTPRVRFPNVRSVQLSMEWISARTVLMSSLVTRWGSPCNG